MKEYTIYMRRGDKKPYTVGSYKDLTSAKLKLYDIIGLEIERKRPFYVDNDFFDNKYNLGSQLLYICILEREVQSWKKFQEFSDDLKSTNNISFLCNYF